MADMSAKHFINNFKSRMEPNTSSLTIHPLNEDLNPIKRLEILIDKYGYEWLGWEAPETLWQQIGKDFNLPDAENNVLYREEKDQIMAIKTAALSDSPWQDHDVFENVGNAFNGNCVIFIASQPLSPAQCAFTVHILRKLRPTEEFGLDVKKYIAVSFFERGYVLMPGMVSFAQEDLDKLGAQDEDLKRRVKDAWFNFKTKTELKVVKSDTVLNQIARLETIDIFIEEKLK